MRWLLAVISAVLLAVIPVSAATGHASLKGSNPEDGASLDVAPEEVVLTFSEELLTELVEISVLDADDNPVVVTEVPQTPPPGTDVKVPWPADLPAGEYSVAFRVVSADGHPVTGRVTFSYANSREMAAAPSEPEATAEPTPELIAETPDSQPTADQEAATPTPEQISEEIVAADEPNESLIGPLLIAAAVIVGIGVIVSIVMLARSRQ
jgi:hypothetical protein